MEEDLEFILDSADEAMKNSILHLKKQLVNIRAGKASPAMVGSVMVDYYGSLTPLTQIANVNTPDGRTLTIQPWERAMIPEIEKAIMNSNLGFNPMNNGESIIINVPPLTEERRKDLVKQAKGETEDAKVGVRNDRKVANNDIKKLEKDGLAEDVCRDAEKTIQTLTDKYIKVIDDIFVIKEKEILTV